MVDLRVHRVCLLFPAGYLEEIQSVRRHTNSMLDTSKSLNPPVVVHCSAGVGRTGVVILTELMISCLEHNEVSGFDIFNRICITSITLFVYIYMYIYM